MSQTLRYTTWPRLLIGLTSFFFSACTTIHSPEGAAGIPPLNQALRFSVSVATPGPLPPLTSDIHAFAAKVASQNGLQVTALLAVLTEAKIEPGVIDLMNRPFEHLPWYRYQELYVRPSLVKGGLRFWQQNQQSVVAAAKQYGIPPQIIIAILGVETAYGQNIGRYRALDALYTLAFHYPRRAAFFEKELEAYLVLVEKAGLDPFTTKSSYAGALGVPQFMPTIYRRYGVSDSSAYPNLFSNTRDITRSVAYYLHEMGWKPKEPIAVEVRTQDKREATSPLFSGKAHLIELEGKNGPEYWLVFRNFYVLKKYNASNLYALAVFQLAEKIACGIPPHPSLGLTCPKGPLTEQIPSPKADGE